MKGFEALMAAAMILGLLISPIFLKTANSAGSAPPIEQPLVREGDLALELARSLGLPGGNEAQALSSLSTAGLTPRNGWVSDYPVTPTVLAELRESATGAAESGKLAMNPDEAAGAVQKVSASMGLPITVAGGKVPPEANFYGEGKKIPPQRVGYSTDTTSWSNRDPFPPQRARRRPAIAAIA